MKTAKSLQKTNLNFKKGHTKIAEKPRGNFIFSWAFPILSGGLGDRSSQCEGLILVLKEEKEALLQKIFVCIDQFGGYLKDWCMALRFVLDNLGLFQGKEAIYTQGIS